MLRGMAMSRWRALASVGVSVNVDAGGIGGISTGALPSDLLRPL
jgi:hypothetical protein